MGVSGALHALGPAVDLVAPPLQFHDGRLREAALDIEQNTCLAELEAPRKPAWAFHRLLDVPAEIQQPHIGLQVYLGLTVRTHTANDVPQLAVLEGHGSDQCVQRALASLQP